MSDISETGSGNPNPHATINHDYSISEKNKYTARPPTFSGDSTEFEWWKSKMYADIVGLDDELLDILEDGIVIPFNGVGVVAEKKSFTPSHKNIYRKHHRVRSILIDVLPHSEYIKIIDKSTSKTIFESLRATYKGNK